MMTKHTPGPWHTDKGKSFYVFAHGSLAEQAGVTNGPFVCNASTEANARFIAAAPELFDFVIQYLYSEHGTCAPHHDAAPYSPEELKTMAEKLIAKVEGGGK